MQRPSTITTAVLALTAGLTIGGVAVAWSQGGASESPVAVRAVAAQDDPATTTTTAAPGRWERRQDRLERRQDRLERRKDRLAARGDRLAPLRDATAGTVTVRDDDGTWIEVSFARGTLESASASSVVVARLDGAEVTVSVDSTTKVIGGTAVTDLTLGEPVMVVYEDGQPARVVAQHPGGRRGGPHRASTTTTTVD